MASFDLFSIGHSNVPAERFLGLLQNAGVNMIADVRSVPASRRFPWFSKHCLAARLAAAGVGYQAMGIRSGAGRAMTASIVTASSITRRWRCKRSFAAASIA